MTPRFKSSDQASRSEGNNGSNPPSNARQLTVQDVIHEYREYAMDMDFHSVLTKQQNDVDLSWMVCRIQRKNPDARHDAAVLTIAYGLSLQQLGYHEEAKQCFDRLLVELGIQPTRAGLIRLHDGLAEETGDDALTLLLRLDPAPLGTEECGRNLENAFNLLRTRKNKAKFYWRLQLNNVLMGNRVDSYDFERRYFDLTGRDCDTAPGNATNIPLCQAISRALHERPDRNGKYWDQALHMAYQAYKTTQDRLLNSKTNRGHLITHTCISTLREFVYYKWCIAVRRGKKGQMRELASIWNDTEDLRHDARIRPKADGCREIDQINAVLFGKEMLSIVSTATERPKVTAKDAVSRKQRLLTLTDHINNL